MLRHCGRSLGARLGWDEITLLHQAGTFLSFRAHDDRSTGSSAGRVHWELMRNREVLPVVPLPAVEEQSSSYDDEECDTSYYAACDCADMGFGFVSCRCPSRFRFK